VNHTFIRVINHIRFCRTVGGEVFAQTNMLSDDVSNFGITQVDEQLLSSLCVILMGLDASRFGYIVHQCSSLDKVRVEVCLNGPREEHGYAADLK